MMRIRQWLSAVLIAATLGGGVLAILPSPALAATPAPTCNATFLTFPAWYRGLTDAKCEVKNPKTMTGGLQSFILKVVANIVEVVLQLVGYVSFGFIIYGGFLYMIATGDPGKLAGAKSTILNAVIGLVIAIFAVAIINFVSSGF